MGRKLSEERLSAAERLSERQGERGDRKHTHPEVSKANFQEESRPDATRGRQPLFIYFCLSGCR